jgi:hypothetical protein
MFSKAKSIKNINTAIIREANITTTALLESSFLVGQETL